MKILKAFMKKLSTDNKINIIGHCLTLISLLLIFFTLVEMQTQRNAAYMPYIVAEFNDTVKMSWNGIDGLSFSNAPEYDNIHPPIYFDVYNIGDGIAKNVQFQWMDNNIVRLSEYINDNSTDFHVNLGGQMPRISAYGIEASGKVFERNLNYSFLSTGNYEPYKINVPYNYLLCYKFMQVASLDEYPEIHLKVSYEDIQGKAYEQILVINWNPGLYAYSNGHNGEDFSGYVDIGFTVN